MRLNYLTDSFFAFIIMNGPNFCTFFSVFIVINKLVINTKYQHETGATQKHIFFFRFSKFIAKISHKMINCNLLVPWHNGEIVRHLIAFVFVLISTDFFYSFDFRHAI